MPLPAYQQYRPITPPVGEVPALCQGRRPSDASQWSIESLPESLDAYARTPLDRSPVRYQSSQKVLPKLRTQDHTLGLQPTYQSNPIHRRAVSTGYEPPVRPVAAARAITSPLERIPTPDPESAISACFSAVSDYATFESPVNLLPSVSRTVRSGHGRSVSSASVDHSTLLKYCNPGYRAPPSYLSQAYWNDAVDGSSTFIPPPVSASAETVAPVWDLPQEMQFTQPNDATMSLNEYLRAPNPAIDLCQTLSCPIPRNLQNHFWWDIRNLRSWKGFTLENILALPHFPSLLNVPVSSAAFPDPTASLSRAALNPENEAALTDTIRTFYATKLNAALKVAVSANHALAMRVCRDRDGPAFVSNYQDDFEKTLAGNGRGRVVGIVRSYRAWNSSMRSGNAVDKVRYLEALALLHRHMREHQTRYGFIMTETELVCARAGEEDTPYFGFLELTAPIETRVHGSNGADAGLATPPLSDTSSNHSRSQHASPAKNGGNDATGAGAGLTACIALWYLHMLAKEEPLPGQPSWRLHVGAPAAMTRQRTLPERDSGLPNPQRGEQRIAKTVRGWVWPSDPWNKKREGGKIGGRR